ncbi:carbohydrate sulfotransferase 1 [Patella vulgata]|uniref:carbohydrate sulfotransferase 1 n=1 Tax=Patella vulgata TaxID=6465 RepID=UPI0024A9372B|nr:carbohydrate sulfotransferase 1 [Patella vulgata]
MGCTCKSSFIVIFLVAATSLAFLYQTSFIKDIGERTGYLALKEPLIQPIRNGTDNLIGLASTIENVKTVIARYEQTNRGPEVNVLLLTYMRSGSTFTADLLQQSREVFYVFEPLTTLSRYNVIPPFVYIPMVTFDQAPIYYLQQMVNFKMLSKRLLNAFLTCKFSQADMATLIQFHLRNSLTTIPFYNCTRQYKGIFGVFRCLPHLYERCLRSRITITKTIRTRMQTGVEMLQSNPNLKIIHLIRDPRGTLMSEFRFGKFPKQELLSYATTFCKNVTEDLEIAQTYPDRVKIIRYEDLCDNPFLLSKKLYDYIGMEFTSEIKEYIHSITSAGKEVNCPLCTSRADSKMASKKWRKQITIKDALTIDNVCSNVFDKLGYKPVNSLNELRNLNVSFVAKPKINVLG